MLDATESRIASETPWFQAAASKKLAVGLIASVRNPGGASYVCPVCNYAGRFVTEKAETGYRADGRCPVCGSLERHRLQVLAMNAIGRERSFAECSILHFAPEPFFESVFRKAFRKYVSADLFRTDVDVQMDISDLKFPDDSFDFVYASHVLEHVFDDIKAAKEIFRVLKRGGVAILPVPIVSDQTVEYPEPNPHEAMHVRAPGLDYFERLRGVFTSVDVLTSRDVPEKYQTYIHEDRSGWPTNEMPLRKAQSGLRHLDAVPVCRK